MAGLAATSSSSAVDGFLLLLAVLTAIYKHAEIGSSCTTTYGDLSAGWHRLVERR